MINFIKNLVNYQELYINFIDIKEKIEYNTINPWRV